MSACAIPAFKGGYSEDLPVAVDEFAVLPGGVELSPVVVPEHAVSIEKAKANATK